MYTVKCCGGSSRRFRSYTSALKFIEQEGGRCSFASKMSTKAKKRRCRGY